VPNYRTSSFPSLLEFLTPVTITATFLLKYSTKQVLKEHSHTFSYSPNESKSLTFCSMEQAINITVVTNHLKYAFHVDKTE
jgi:hypothetical protein